MVLKYSLINNLFLLNMTFRIYKKKSLFLVLLKPIHTIAPINIFSTSPAPLLNNPSTKSRKKQQPIQKKKAIRIAESASQENTPLQIHRHKLPTGRVRNVARGQCYTNKRK